MAASRNRLAFRGAIVHGTVLAPSGRRMPWFDAPGGQLRFRGRVTREPVAAWIASRDGQETIQAVASRIRFSVLGRTRSARRRVTRELSAAIGAPELREVLADECSRYLARWSGLAYAPSLPRATVALRRLVVVPRTLVLGRTLSPLTVRLAACPPLAAVPDPFKQFLARWIVEDMNRAIGRAAPSPKRPVPVHGEWMCVALDTGFQWIDPLWSGAGWGGHAMLFEMPPAPLRRRERQELETAIETLRAALPTLSRQQRDSIVRLAVDNLAALQV